MKTISDIQIHKVIGSSIAQESKEEVLKSNVGHIKEHSNIPLRYAEAEFEARNEYQEKLIQKFKSNFLGKKINEVGDMLISGNIGTGKTYLSIAFLHKLISHNIYCRYTTEHYLLELYFQKQYDQFRAFRDVKVLLIDELGKRPLQDWQMIQLEELLSHRFNNMLPTIFITNLEETEFKNFIGQRLTDRLRENGIVRCVMRGESLRGAV